MVSKFQYVATVSTNQKRKETMPKTLLVVHPLLVVQQLSQWSVVQDKHGIGINTFFLINNIGINTVMRFILFTMPEAKSCCIFFYQTI